jgi:hypothetical protein
VDLGDTCRSRWQISDLGISVRDLGDLGGISVTQDLGSRWDLGDTGISVTQDLGEDLGGSR